MRICSISQKLLRPRARAGPNISAVAVLVLTALLAVGNPTPARAQLVMQILNSTASSPGTGTFDVILKDTGGTFTVGGFSVEMTVGSGVNFTAADTNTVAPNNYIFGTLQSPPFTFNTFPTNDLVVSDFGGPTTLNTNDLFGLAHISYSVPAGLSGQTIPLVLASIGAGSSISDPDGNEIPFTGVNGAITVSGAVGVPEPTPLLLAGVAATAAALLRVRRRLTVPSFLRRRDA